MSAVLNGLIICKKHDRIGPKGYPVRRYIATAEVIDHQEDIVDIRGMLEVMPIMLKQGGRIQDFHSNKPGGEFFDYGIVPLRDMNGEEVAALWLDLEVYNDYPTQQETLRRIDLPPEDKEAIRGLSLGGFTLKGYRRCDEFKCWNHLRKIEGWEWSFVDDPANPLALELIDYDPYDMGTLQLNVAFDDVYLKEGITVAEAEKILKGAKSEDVEGIIKKDCKKCDKDPVTKMDDKKKMNPEDMESDEGDVPPKEGAPTEEEQPEGEGESESIPDAPGDEPGEEEEKMTDPEEAPEEDSMDYGDDGSSGMAGAFDQPTEMGSLEEVNSKLDTMMSALNIGQNSMMKNDQEALQVTSGESRAETQTIEKKEILMTEETVTINGVEYVKKEKPAPQYIEKDGKKYQLVEAEAETPKTITKSKAEEDLEKKLSFMTSEITKLKSQSTQVIVKPEDMRVVDELNTPGDITGATVKKQIDQAISETIKEYPYLETEFMDYTIRNKFFEDNNSLESEDLYMQ